MHEKKVTRLDRKIDDLRRRVKGAEDLRTATEVFDRPTLMSLYYLAKRGYIDTLYGVVKTGKEANVLRARNAAGDDVAVKIYRVGTSDYNAMFQYLHGDPRFGKVRRDRRSIVYTWVKKEFKNLSRARDAGATVPAVLAFRNNVLVMEFLGEGGVPYPMLKDCKLEKPGAFFAILLNEVKAIYCGAGLVHSDLSEYNILVRDERPIIIDMSQAVLRDHPRSEEFLNRDVANLVRFFKNEGISEKDIMEALKRC
jgi:RIO kinase 1